MLHRFDGRFDLEGRQLGILTGLLFVGVLMGALDLAIIGPALPAMQAQFELTERQLAWLFNIYVLFQLVGTPLLAKLSDRFGTRAIYMASIGAFATGSLLLVMSPWPQGLFVGRAIQGFGGGGIFPVAAAVIGQMFPTEKRGGVLGLLGAVFGLAFLLGPILGGLLLPFGWQWLFLINLPIAAMLIAGAWILLSPARPATGAAKAFDWRGALSLSVALTTMTIAVTNIDSAHLATSVASINVWPWAACCAIFAPVFWRIERRAADPIVRPAFFENRQISLTALISLGIGTLESGTVFYPLLAVSAIGVSDAVAAWLLVPGVVVTTIAAPVIGMLIERLGTRNLIVAGLGCLFTGILMYGTLEITVVTFIAAGMIAGLGFGAAHGAPLRVILLNETGPDDRTAGQGVLNVSLSIGQLLGAAIVGGIAASRGGGTTGYQTAFGTLAAFTGLLLFVGLLLKSRAAERAANEAARA